MALFRGALEAVGCFRMKLNICFLATGSQKLIEVDDERNFSIISKANGKHCDGVIPGSAWPLKE